MNNKHFVLPKVFLVGYTNMDLNGMLDYLRHTGQEDFFNEIKLAKANGLSDGEILCSFYAKLCYKSLIVGKNDNITKVRAIEDNIASIIETGHGSVIEHASLNFVVTDCSRVFTHELVRHRVGTAFSQTSGRYVRGDELNIVIDPILEPIAQELEYAREYLEGWYERAVKKLGLADEKNFTRKKKLTSALRRMLPNGQANEIGVTLNLRTMRSTIEARTSSHAEWEIRYIFNQIYGIVFHKYKLMFVDASTELVDDLFEITFKNKKI